MSVGGMGAEELARLQAMQQAAGDQGAGPFARLMYENLIPGAGKQQADALAAQTGDFGASGLGATMQAASGAQDLSPTKSAMASVAGKALSLIGHAGDNLDDPKNRAIVTMGYGLLSPPQRDSRPPPPTHGSGGGSTGPLPVPYQQNQTQLSGISPSGPPPGMSWADWLRQRMMRGY